jgi:hypothetical protein
MTNDYLLMDRLEHFYNHKFFTHKCPVPLPADLMLLKSLEEAYQSQETQYLTNPDVKERLEAMDYLEREFGYLLEPPTPQPPKAVKKTDKRMPEKQVGKTEISVAS